ncbi:MAG: PQQ-binding-like beta-propeller repeat protein, partial [Planctomycetes bacterium]|nr:PQQ-binding-like beta-propeller repeat protein [Planctomycetota bacterium]
LLGNDRMISRWPARGGPVVIDGLVMFAAGIWPSEGIFVRGIRAATGEVVWRNDDSGSIEMDQPHPTARARSGISAQGYLAAADDALLVPTGRAVPAALDPRDGRLRFFQLRPNQMRGGSDAVIIGGEFYNGAAAYALESGAFLGSAGIPVAAHPDLVIASGGGAVAAFDRRAMRAKREVADRQGKRTMVEVLAPPIWKLAVPFDAEGAGSAPDGPPPEEVRMGSTAWSTPFRAGTACEMIVAGGAIVAGGRGRVTIIDIASRKVSRTIAIEGAAHGLAAAGGRLYASTDRGEILCFGGAGQAGSAPIEHRPPRAQAPDPRDADPVYDRAAEEIIRRTGVREGFALDLACGDGRLASALARRTALRIYAVDEDAERVAAARRALDAAGLYGTRVTVHRADPSGIPYPDHFADLAVSGRSVREGPAVAPAGAIRRLLCPSSGIACIGIPGAMEMRTRGPLEGAGRWTHQNASAANTLCSGDALLREPLEMLWFRDTDLVMANRHGRGPGPLVDDGRMVVEGLDALRALNIYNGRTLWEIPLPGILRPYHGEASIGAAWTGGNYCLGEGRVYIHDGRRCLCLDARTGRKVGEYAPPVRPDGRPGAWGYLACEDGILFGSVADEEYLIKGWSPRWDTSRLFTESILFFALDARSGDVKWTFAPRRSIRHNAIAVGGGRVFLIDRARAAGDDVRSGWDESGKTRPAAEHPPGRLLALEARTGDTIWEREDDIFGTMLAWSAEHEILLMAYQAAHQASRESERGDRLAGFRAADGARLWDASGKYEDRPIVNGRTIFAPPGAWDLLTGEKLSFALDRSYGCGISVGSKHLLVFRSATVGYLDLDGARRTENYGGIRPGCWIPGIPAGGLLLMADAASWCTCSYLIQATIALRPRARDGIRAAPSE